MVSPHYGILHRSAEKHLSLRELRSTQPNRSNVEPHRLIIGGGRLLPKRRGPYTNPYRDTKCHDDPNDNRNTDADTNIHGDPNTYGDINIHDDTNDNRNTDADTNIHRDPNTYGDINTYDDTNTDPPSSTASIARGYRLSSTLRRRRSADRPPRWTPIAIRRLRHSRIFS